MPDSEGGNNLDASDDVAVKTVEFLRRHPKLTMARIADDVDLVAFNEFGIDFELCHEARPTLRNVPVSRNLNCVLFVQDWVEDRLSRQTGRKCGPAGCLDQRQLDGTDRSEEGN